MSKTAPVSKTAFARLREPVAKSCLVQFMLRDPFASVPTTSFASARSPAAASPSAVVTSALGSGGFDDGGWRGGGFDGGGGGFDDGTSTTLA